MATIKDLTPLGQRKDMFLKGAQILRAAYRKK